MNDNKSDSSVGKAGATSTRGRAEEYAKDPERTRKLLDEAMRKAQQRKGRLSEVWDSLMALFRLVRAWVEGRYNKVPWQSIVLAISAIAYFFMPLDFIPDWIIALGYLDDAAVIAWVIKSIADDLDAFKEWEANQAAT